MLSATVNSLTEMFSGPLRRVLWKSIGLALLLIAFIGIGLHRLFAWLTQNGAA